MDEFCVMDAIDAAATSVLTWQKMIMICCFMLLLAKASLVFLEAFQIF